MALIRRIKIEGLHGQKVVDLKIRGRHCIIVGPNGSGKSTALQIVAYALGRQWKALSKLNFDEVELTFDNDQSISLSRENCASFAESSGGSPRFSRHQRTLAEHDAINAFVAADLSKPSILEEFSQLIRASPAEVRLTQRYLRSTSRDKGAQAAVLEFQKGLATAEVPATFYLPTYRRIELEIDRMIQNAQEYYRAELRRSITTGFSTEFMIELVRFGMDDVAQAIQNVERQTKDFAKYRFNRMMTSYLKEMANSQVLSVSDLRSHQIDKEKIDLVLSRIEEGAISETEKAKISSIVLELAGGPGAGNQPFNKKWLAHFFVRLLEVNTDIENRELPLRNFVASLDRYFSPKSVSYDVESYHFSISEESGREIALSELSSGEKQIVSLLSHFYLSDGKVYNVFIDEPELSLSVPWQSELLPDIAGTPSCQQIFAVTHSPFVYDNILSSSVVDFFELSEG